jgi:DivIVA domain-containing protein
MKQTPASKSEMAKKMADALKPYSGTPAANTSASSTPAPKTPTIRAQKPRRAKRPVDDAASDKRREFLEWFDNAGFDTHRFREGYDLDQVDDFLDEVRVRVNTLLGR